MKKYRLFLFSLLIIMGSLNANCKENPRLFAGGYAKGDEKGLYVFELNNSNGDLTLFTQTDAGPNPAYFCYSEKYGMLYVANEVMQFKGNSGGGLTTLKYDKTNMQFEKLNELLIPDGGPCYISISPDNNFLFLANYPRGSVAVVRLSESGIPESVTDTIFYAREQLGNSHAHMILHHPAGKRIFVTDLGLDRIMVYDFDRSAGKLIPAENGAMTLPKGTGPRHFTFSADGSKLYVINELGSTLMVFDIDEKQGLKLIQTFPTVMEGFADKNYCADIHIGADGKFLYGSNRGENSIVVFKIAQDGSLTLAGHSTCGGDWPRSFVIDPSGNFLLVANQRSDQVSVFRINKKTGIPEGPVSNVTVTAPACVKFF